MLLTPDEARTMWCPKALSPTQVNQFGIDGPIVVINRDVHGAPQCSCLAEACMAWRWASSLTVNNPGQVPGAGQQINRTHGYCGLAGEAMTPHVPSLEAVRRANAADRELLSLLRDVMTPAERREFDAFVARLEREPARPIKRPTALQNIRGTECGN